MALTLVIFLVGTLILPGCGNTLIFAERASFKLGVQVNDNPVTPVEVNAGLKRSVIALVPPSEGLVESDKSQEAKGEAVNLVSGFNLRYDPSETKLFGKLTIRSQFASGQAAYNLAGDTEAVNKIVKVRLVRPVPEGLQKRREAAAAFVKTLSQPPELDALAKSLGKDGGANAQLNVLDAISAAETPEAFEIIAQKLKILFGKEV